MSAEVAAATTEVPAPAAAATETPAAETKPAAATKAPAKAEGKQKDSDSPKLFIGQIPRDMAETDVKAVFDEFGEVFEVVILKDKFSGQPQGCGFVSYMHKADATKAIAGLHDKKVLPGSANAMQVKVADSEKRKDQDKKLFVGMTGRLADESMIKKMFDPYGVVEEVTILKHPDGNSKGCGFVMFATREQGQSAINALNGSTTLDGATAPLVVKFADTDKDKAAKRQTHGGPQHGNSNGYGGGFQQNMPNPYMQNPYMMQQPMMQQQSPYMNQGYPMMGQQPYGGYGQAPGMPPQGGMGMPPQQPGAEPAAGGMGAPPQAPAPYGGYNPMQQPQPYGAPPAGAYGMGTPAGSAGMSAPSSAASSNASGPEGANLFVYHVPNEWTDNDLYANFAPFGTVLSAKVFIDKNTGLSKCFGFVSYDNAASASAAIQSMNGYRIANKMLKVQLKRPRDSSRPY
ncbi:hypothetical protein SARC_10001 [Sphaeroforma arctica JP610]|uniref:RRM domain-containing protein n=1 Tax=Sphaeroforma arctica JP610 TaxID=667725 RepID=A0A0L0FLA2_9EUKA|nr:hypothetical protein SARC_10001 [Sphaeroforma arctica JP610]KNC77540.1 hypothetical protein SARC_10001 [Sphaeroforma arctica JP610]|eukprot:XP_014151442.1 hypothetical protein SARC_10001 [Sphaeroforma arctica JP610]